MKIARVFPRKTKMTPGDSYAFIGPPGFFVPTDIEEVHISVVFTYDIPQAEFLAEQWKHIAPVKIGGPAFNVPGEEFVPGMYLKRGGVVTSRGCPNRCWFCMVWRREDEMKELEIKNGHHLCDDNILAMSENHVRRVFDMLSRQRRRVKFGGGLEAALLKDWHLELMHKLRRRPAMYFAYDEEADYEPLVEAAKMLRKTELMTACMAKCYMLIGYPKDTMEKAEKRIKRAVRLGFFPVAMLYRNHKGETLSAWRRFQSGWCRPQIVAAKIKKMISNKEIMPDKAFFPAEI